MKAKKSSQPRASLLQKAAITLLGLLISLVLLEGGLRLGGFVLLSLQEYGNVRSIKQKGAYRILCLGESTTQGQYPSLLEKALNEDPIGVRFSVIDKGITGTITPVILSRVESFLDEYHPNMVVAMMGINDQRVKYYQDISESHTWIFQHCRIYRFGRILYMHLLKKLRKKDIYVPDRSDREREPDNGNAIEKPDLSDNVDVHGTSKLGSKNDNESPTTSGASKQANNLFESPKFPAKPVDYFTLGQFYQDQGEFTPAEDSFKKAIEMNPNNDHAYTRLGRLYLDQGKLSLAEDSFKKAIAINPKKDNAYMGLGRLYLDQGEASKVEAFFKKAIELNPKNKNAYAGLGRFYLEQGKPSQAENSFQKVTELEPKSDFAYAGLGRVLQDQGKFLQAEDSFKKAIEINPKNDNAYAGLARLYQEQGKFSTAEGLLKTAIEINPKNDRLLRSLSSLFKEMGHPALGEAYAEKADRLRESLNPMTRNNYYRKLKDILDSHGIKLVCVQYPMRDVAPLKKLFEKDENVIFVDNERIFKEALKKEGYKEYFVDTFAGDFGHCTQKGNKLLAQNIAEVILREVFHK